MRTDDETFTSIHSYFTWDHHRLDRQLTKVAGLLDDEELPLAEKAFAHYMRGLRHHMKQEEDLLAELYAFERTGAARSPAPEVQAEHEQILKVVEAMHLALLAGDKPRYETSHQHLGVLMAPHCEREEKQVYPFLDAILGSAEAERTVARLRTA